MQEIQNLSQEIEQLITVAEKSFGCQEEIEKNFKKPEERKKFQDIQNALLNIAQGKVKTNLFLFGSQSCGKTSFLNTLIQKMVFPIGFDETTQYQIYLSWRPKNEKYKLFKAKYKNFEGIQVVEKQSIEPEATGAQNIYEYLNQKSNKKIIKSNKNMQNIEKLSEEISELQIKKKLNDSQKQEIQEKQKKIQEYQTQMNKVPIFIYEGPIPKLDAFGSILQKYFYIVDMPGLDSQNQEWNKQIQDMFCQQDDILYFNNNPIMLIEDGNLTKNSFSNNLVTINKFLKNKKKSIKQQLEVYEQLDDYNQIQNGKDFDLKQMLAQKPFQNIIEDIFSNFEESDLFELHCKQNFEYINQDFYKVIYQKESQDYLKKKFKQCHEYEQNISEIFKLHLQKFKQNLSNLIEIAKGKIPQI
ncbi:P-loop containing nucleoside triphosphate hydrolase [Pseudocohnilembus persalinus]|uniref:p-loop containing nucleoside triphosphate hydrolase n=1 Tax=Pseudocohnilembus persalinus TaxID=266149 RepID=A0A0V0QU86_PSEPJ|nr:P-loop containing nucleoside triphosphate hydrolase [Pseudocohnilembus persalinus]|eukprot:KRX05828.1 P-loop containing nucleoside triphosphate hydrolase [Pseudocohnilembus persalinus]